MAISIENEENEIIITNQYKVKAPEDYAKDPLLKRAEDLMFAIDSLQTLAHKISETHDTEGLWRYSFLAKMSLFAGKAMEFIEERHVYKKKIMAFLGNPREFIKNRVPSIDNKVNQVYAEIEKIIEPCTPEELISLLIFPEFANTNPGYYSNALQSAVQFDLQGLIKIAIARGIDINDDRLAIKYRNKNAGDTLLISAALNNQVDLVRFLLENGANVNARNKKQKRALEAALEERQDNQQDDDDDDVPVPFINEFFRERARKAREKILGMLRAADELFEVAKTNNVKKAVELLKAGASVYQQNELGQTPLDVALEHKQKQMAHYLKSKGSNNALKIELEKDLNEKLLWIIKDTSAIQWNEVFASTSEQSLQGNNVIGINSRQIIGIAVNKMVLALKIQGVSSSTSEKAFFNLLVDLPTGCSEIIGSFLFSFSPKTTPLVRSIFCEYFPKAWQSAWENEKFDTLANKRRITEGVTMSDTHTKEMDQEQLKDNEAQQQDENELKAFPSSSITLEETQSQRIEKVISDLSPSETEVKTAAENNTEYFSSILEDFRKQNARAILENYKRQNASAKPSADEKSTSRNPGNAELSHQELDKLRFRN